ncbi:MAG: ATP-binding protein [Clostridia bacterium]|nr:ATP-binding protein [Clostridia bacterium]
MRVRKEMAAEVEALLERRRSEAERKARVLKEGLYAHCPQLKDLEREQAALLGQMTAIALKKQGGDVDEVRRRCEAIDRRRAALLQELGLGEDALRPAYTCPRCEDRGFVDGRPCRCYVAALRQLSYERSPMGAALRDQTFESFDLRFYSDRPDESGISPRQVMRRNLETAKEFVERFPDGGRSLLLTGPSGLGKTHLSSAIGGELAARGWHVVYEMAPTLLQRLEDIKFGRAAADEAVQECDLLIVDDLGSEFITPFTTSALFALLGERLVRGRPGIVSTNFTHAELEEQYTKKLASRLCYDYETLIFRGSDIRGLKRREKITGLGGRQG